MMLNGNRSWMAVAIFLVLLMIPMEVAGQSLEDPEVQELFVIARGLFDNIRKRNYVSIWDGITAKSRKKIVDTVYKEQKKTKEKLTRDQIRRDFDACGTMCKAYWGAYSRAFNPASALQQSRWDIGFIKKKKAEIWITHQNADRPAKLKLFREKGEWKVGLMETFWTYWTRK